MDNYTLVSDATGRQGDNLAPINAHYQQHTAKYRTHDYIASFQVRIFSWTKRTDLRPKQSISNYEYVCVEANFQKKCAFQAAAKHCIYHWRGRHKNKKVQHKTAMAKQHPATIYHSSFTPDALYSKPFLKLEKCTRKSFLHKTPFALHKRLVQEKTFTPKNFCTKSLWH